MGQSSPHLPDRRQGEVPLYLKFYVDADSCTYALLVTQGTYLFGCKADKATIQSKTGMSGYPGLGADVMLQQLSLLMADKQPRTQCSCKSFPPMVHTHTSPSLLDLEFKCFPGGGDTSLVWTFTLTPLDAKRSMKILTATLIKPFWSAYLYPHLPPSTSAHPAGEDAPFSTDPAKVARSKFTAHVNEVRAASHTHTRGDDADVFREHVVDAAQRPLKPGILSETYRIESPFPKACVPTAAASNRYTAFVQQVWQPADAMVDSDVGEHQASVGIKIEEGEEGVGVGGEGVAAAAAAASSSTEPVHQAPEDPEVPREPDEPDEEYTRRVQQHRKRKLDQAAAVAENKKPKKKNIPLH
ncbi:unnamed protein product [Vitrella brassicaformis CCMP3155]|uniref:Uncharacterized protein n=1 Tax=Vitrella brassicaformis (strain CCMP3155) TaxID=1169540 RepID=A0A0G4FFC9_VITBC|nr:unnamed protein product [Vitrella brassicaformis CCMP3155]|eukprot:CEM11906.1 unnamed protein product [Vitrella brassicaformis CCMP3155]